MALKWRGQEVTDDMMLASAAAIEGLLDEAVAEARATAAFKDKTGKLRRSIRRRKARATRSGVVVKWGAFARHAHLIEAGTVKMDPRPFLEPVATRKYPELPDRLAAELEKRPGR